MYDKNTDRILQTLLALIPACLGLFAFLNNVTDWEGTMTRVVYPLLGMTDNSAGATQGWRAIDSPLLANIAYGLVTSLELLVGLIALYGAVDMARACCSGNGNQSPTLLQRGSLRVRRACLLGIIIYCLAFFTIGGDWFLAWKNENLRFLQGDALNYALVLTIVFLALHLADNAKN